LPRKHSDHNDRDDDHCNDDPNPSVHLHASWNRMTMSALVAIPRNPVSA
jgi:hypothetical protein